VATVFKNPKGSWRCIARRRGHETQSGVFESKGEASRAGNKWEYEFDQGLHKKASNRVIHTLHELFDRYACEVSPNKSGGRTEVIRLSNWANKAEHPEFDCKVRNFGKKEIQSWRDRRLKSVSAASVNRELNLVSSVFTHAIKEWDIPFPANPVSLISRPPKTPARKRRLSSEEIAKLEFGEQKIPRTGLGMSTDYIPWIIEFSVETGMRLGEICALRWKDVHLDDHWLFVAAVEVGAKKNGTAREVPLSERAEEILRTLGKRDPERVFPVHKQSVDTLYRKLRTKLGIENLHIHDARHEAVSQMADKLNILELASVIGHRDLKSLQIYYNPKPADLVKKLRSSPGGPRPTGAHPQSPKPDA
jgi:integrase